MVGESTVYDTRTVYDKTGGGGGEVELSVKILNKWYRVIKANNLYWLAEDLRADFSGLTYNGPYNGPSYRVYDENTTYFLAFGFLYTWHCIQIIQNYLDQNNTGWRVPNTDDFINLFDTVGGQNNCGLALQKKNEPFFNWWNSNNATDEIGFSKGGSGFYEGTYYSIRGNGYVWTSNQRDSNYAKMVAFRDNDKNVPIENEAKKRFLSIRLCKDV